MSSPDIRLCLKEYIYLNTLCAEHLQAYTTLQTMSTLTSVLTAQPVEMGIAAFSKQLWHPVSKHCASKQEQIYFQVNSYKHGHFTIYQVAY